MKEIEIKFNGCVFSVDEFDLLIVDTIRSAIDCDDLLIINQNEDDQE